MSFGEAVSSVLSKYATFSGRARRSEYWYFVLFSIVVDLALNAVLSVLGVRESAAASINSLLSLALFLPGLAVIWRRLHDIGKSGANYFWLLLPVAGFIMFIVWMCRDGDRGPNRYGPDPKAPAGYNGTDRAPWEY